MQRRLHSVHFVGIKGAGVSALAQYCKDLGYTVSGSDVEEGFPTDAALEHAGITPMVGFRPSHLRARPDVVVYSAAFDEDNPEIRFALRHKIPVLSSAEFLAELTDERDVIAVAGTHGKTTTTALIAAILTEAGIDPGYVIGWPMVPQPLVGSGHAGKGPVVLEADEYRISQKNPDPKFVLLRAKTAIITSIEHDHPDMYPSVDAVYDAFYRFAARVRRGGLILGALDSPRIRRLRQLLVDRQFETYGFALDADWRIMDYEIKGHDQSFSLRTKGEKLGPFQLKILGRHNVLNATAAYAVCHHYGVKKSVLEKVLAQFPGVGRRFELIGRFGGVSVVDDYAHHPTAIRSVIETARATFAGKKIWIAFQPHTYSRTTAFFEEFVHALKSADGVIMLPTFASAREAVQSPDPSVRLAERLKAGGSTVHILTLADLPAWVRENLSGQDVLVTAGAGTIAQAPELLRKEFA